MHIISIHFTLFVFLFMLSNHFRQFFTSGCMVFDVNVLHTDFDLRKQRSTDFKLAIATSCNLYQWVDYDA